MSPYFFVCLCLWIILNNHFILTDYEGQYRLLVVTNTFSWRKTGIVQQWFNPQQTKKQAFSHKVVIWRLSTLANLQITNS
jgi:hypothetical protein